MRGRDAPHHLLHAAPFEVLDQELGDRVIVLVARNVPELTGELAEQRQALMDSVG